MTKEQKGTDTDGPIGQLIKDKRMVGGKDNVLGIALKDGIALDLRKACKVMALDDLKLVLYNDKDRPKLVLFAGEQIPKWAYPYESVMRAISCLLSLTGNSVEDVVLYYPPTYYPLFVQDKSKAELFCMVSPYNMEVPEQVALAKPSEVIEAFSSIMGSWTPAFGGGPVEQSTETEVTSKDKHFPKAPARAETEKATETPQESKTPAKVSEPAPEAGTSTESTAEAPAGNDSETKDPVQAAAEAGVELLPPGGTVDMNADALEVLGIIEGVRVETKKAMAEYDMVKARLVAAKMDKQKAVDTINDLLGRGVLYGDTMQGLAVVVAEEPAEEGVE